VFPTPRSVVSFRCGKLTREGNKLTCVGDLPFSTGRLHLRGLTFVFVGHRPDTRKGVLSVVQGLDELTHLVWATRDGADEEDVIIFPAEAKFHKARTLQPVQALWSPSADSPLSSSAAPASVLCSEVRGAGGSQCLLLDAGAKGRGR
jgi:hypothetical protein